MDKRFFKNFIDKIKNKAKNKQKGQAKWNFWEQCVSIKMIFMFWYQNCNTHNINILSKILFS